MSSLPEELADRYRLDREIGHGGAATVWLATDLKHKRPVAIKVLKPDIGRDRFLREIEIVAQLSHPHILPLIDSGSAGDQLYYVVPYVAGETLRALLQRERQLPVDHALSLAREIASALEHAHARGLVHRDIKPENILLADGHAQVADFGIASTRDASTGTHTTVGTVVGTPAYMAPEQAAGENIDARADVYALACVVYEMLAGEPPFTGPNDSILFQQISATPRPITERRPGLKREIGEALRLGLAKTRADRFGSAKAFVDALVTPGPSLKRAPSVAVLPFANLSSDPENEFFADGITEDVIAQLAKVRALKVISRASVMPYKQRSAPLRTIAETLDVGNVLEGSVRKAGDRVRVVANLVEASTERTLWAETYDRRLDDIFAIQSEIAVAIAGSLRTELTREERSRIDREPTSNVLAYTHFLKGRQQLVTWDEPTMLRSLEQLQRAVELDPAFAAAHAELAHAYCELGELGVISGEVAYPRARDAATRALELDPDLAEGHMARGYVKMLDEFDWAGADAAFRRALELKPGYADAYDIYGRLCGALGRFDEAVAMQERAFELDPVSHKTDVATALLRAGRPADAEKAALRSLALDLTYPRAIATLGWAQFRQGRREEGLHSLERAVVLSPDESIWLAQYGQALGLVGRNDEARAILVRLVERNANPYHTAYVEIGLGEFDKALDLLERSIETRSAAGYGIKGSFLWEPVREHPRFRALLRKMNLE